MRHLKSTLRDGVNEAAWAVLIASVAVLLLLPSVAAAIDPPEPLNVLFVANGWYDQEDDIEEHLLDLGCDVTVKKDYRVYGSTDLSVYDLIVITEFAPGLSYSALGNIESSEVPVLIVEYWDFWYSYRLGLTSTEYCGYVGTDTITSIQEGYTDFTSRVGAEALVYQPYYTVYGIDLADVESGVTPLYWSSESFGEVAVLVDYERKIAATGVYDTRKYTIDAWKMFDTLLEQIVPEPPERETMREVAQAFYDSGLYTFLDQVEAELVRDPNSWTIEEVEEVTWPVVARWNLHELWDHVMERTYKGFGLIWIPPIITLGYDHPLRPNVDTLSATNGGIPIGEEEHWFLGKYWGDWDGSTYDILEPPYWDQFHSGTDLGLGLSVELYGRRVYYMGDTTDPDGFDHRWSESVCDAAGGARCDDMILFSTDTDPTDGIDVVPTNEWRIEQGGYVWKPQVIPGVHRDFHPDLHDPGNGVVFWPDSPYVAEPEYTVPTGGVATRIPNTVTLPMGELTILLPGVMLWYGTAIAPYELDSEDPTARPTSWTGCSYDGVTFRACYRDDSGDAVPFSMDVSPLSSTDPGEPARFVQVAAVDLSKSDLEDLCAAHPESPMCDLDDPGVTGNSGGGLLLLGSGRPYRKSGLFLGFIRRMDIGELGLFSGRPLVRYWTGTGWSWGESDAVSVTHYPEEPRCDLFTIPEYCTLLDPDYDHQQPAMFGEISARLIRSSDPDEEPGIVLLGNNLWNTWVYYWKAPLHEPWNGDFSALSPEDTLTSGYGPYIIDGFGDDTYPGSGPDGGVALWHTISVWGFGPYGVYSGEEVIPWP